MIEDQEQDWQSDEDYIRDRFNLYGLKSKFAKYKYRFQLFAYKL